MALSLRITWVIGEMLGLASFSFAIDDVEVHLHGRADVLVPVLGYLHKKHALKWNRDNKESPIGAEQGCLCAAPLAAPPGITREISLFFPIKYEKKGQMVKDQKIFGTGKSVSTDCIPLELGAVLNLERKVSATNETHKMVINAEALLTTQCLINECALQNSFPLFCQNNSIIL